MTTPQPPHLIDALADLDEPLAPAYEVGALPPDAGAFDEPPARRQPGTVWGVELEDGQQLEVRTTNRDLIAWEKTRARHREWPDSSDAPIFATTFVIWAAARRDGMTSLTFDQFVEACVDFEKIAEAPADPTR